MRPCDVQGSPNYQRSYQVSERMAADMMPPCNFMLKDASVTVLSSTPSLPSFGVGSFVVLGPLCRFAHGIYGYTVTERTLAGEMEHPPLRWFSHTAAFYEVDDLVRNGQEGVVFFQAKSSKDRAEALQQLQECSTKVCQGTGYSEGDFKRMVEIRPA